MIDVATAAFEGWHDFYVIVGAAAGGLTGLQFVVMTLIAQSGPSKTRGETIAAFGTPNVVHFCAALLASAIMTVPWSALRSAGLALAVCGIAGTVYSLIVMRRASAQSTYQPVFEDWLWHTALPFVAYAALLVAGSALWRQSTALLPWIGMATLLLVFIGIHNAWDTVTFLLVQGVGSQPASPDAAPAAAVARTEDRPEETRDERHTAGHVPGDPDRPAV